MATLVDKYFSKLDLEAIERAVSDAEQKSSGELVVQIASCSRNWRLERVLVAILFGVGAMIKGLLLTREQNWGYYYNFTQGALFGLVGFLVAYVVIGKLLKLRKRRRAIVWKRALELFSQLTPTKGNTAVLIFVSIEEEQSAIVADKLIASKLPADYWDKPQAMLMNGIAKGAHAEGMIDAITEIGGQLATYFPRQSDDTNELPNRPTILDR
ncbi:MAG: hypothetical protein NDJ18_04530 [candidate division Zixibacteria bacterium]|nr:hypothetical protein [candidate division Zixibacteria bacterium]